MRQVNRHPYDPAPSRMAWRLQRLMLTPGFVTGMRILVPVLVVAGGLSIWLGDAERRAALVAKWTDLRESVQQRPEFMIEVHAIEGASDETARLIRRTLALELPVSSFDLDMNALRAEVSGLPPVLSVTMRMRSNGTLATQVKERAPAVLWRTRAGLGLLDAEGMRIRDVAARSVQSDLPVIAGAGADRAVAQALRIIHAAQPLGARMRGLVRIGERRWDLVLDRGQRIMLPAREPVAALERVIALSQAQDILARDLSVVDMRIGARPTIRLNEAAAQDWWQLASNETGG